MKFILGLMILITMGCSKTTAKIKSPETNLLGVTAGSPLAATLETETPIVKGDCYELKNETFKVTVVGEHGVGMVSQRDDSGFHTLPKVDFVKVAKKAVCTTDFLNKHNAFIKKYNKKKFVEASTKDAKFSPGQCIHFDRHNVLITVVSDGLYGFARPQYVEEKNKLHMAPVKQLDEQSVLTDCFEDLRKQHVASLKKTK